MGLDRGHAHVCAHMHSADQTDPDNIAVCIRGE